MTTSSLPGRGIDARAAAWWVALGALAGAISGMVVGGIGGRIVMLILRENSPRAIGATSDDGFEIGQVTLGGSLNLAVGMTIAGALVGVAYVAFRTALHPAARVPLAALFGAAAGGSAFVNPDGIDLRILAPRRRAVAVQGVVTVVAIVLIVLASVDLADKVAQVA